MPSAWGACSRPPRWSGLPSFGWRVFGFLGRFSTVLGVLALVLFAVFSSILLVFRRLRVGGLVFSAYLSGVSGAVGARCLCWSPVRFLPCSLLLLRSALPFAAFLGFLPSLLPRLLRPWLLLRFRPPARSFRLARCLRLAQRPPPFSRCRCRLARACAGPVRGACRCLVRAASLAPPLSLAPVAAPGCLCGWPRRRVVLVRVCSCRCLGFPCRLRLLAWASWLSPSPLSLLPAVSAPSSPVALAAGFPLVGVSGPRSCSCSPGPCSCGRAACVSAAASFCAALAALPSRPAVAVGCVSGVSAVCRAAFGAPGAVSAPARGGCVSPAAGLSVWAVGSAGFGAAVGRAAFAARSLAFVRSVAAAGGCFVSFLPGPCPPGVSPSAPFSGGGSGSWGSAAAALAAGCASLAFLPASVPGFASSFPARWGGRFAPVAVVPGVGSWWFAPALPPCQPVLLS